MTNIILEFDNLGVKGDIQFRIIRQDVVNREDGTDKVCNSDMFRIASCDFPDISESILWLRGHHFTEDKNWVWTSDKRRLHTVFDVFLFFCDRFIKPERINL